jgi:hypothetical protein
MHKIKPNVFPDDYNRERARLISNVRALAEVADLMDHREMPDTFNMLMDVNYRIERFVSRLKAEAGKPGSVQAGRTAI